MTPHLPLYYTNLRPFLETFRSGVPILTYHHIAPPRRGARLKGLYLRPRLFERQLSELCAEGFGGGDYSLLSNMRQKVKAARSLGSSGEQAKVKTRPVFVTFDDAFRDVVVNGLPILQRHGFTGMLFVLAQMLSKTNEWQQRGGDVPELLMTESEVREWVVAGQQLGSHTLTHPRLTQLTPEAAWQEISDSKKVLEDRFGIPVRHFCYPYGDVNEQIRDLVIRAGYETACTTVPGINEPGGDVFMLKRFTARYTSRTLKNLWRALWTKS